MPLPPPGAPQTLCNIFSRPDSISETNKKGKRLDSLASRVTRFAIGASVVEGCQATGAFGCPLFPVHVQGQPLLQVLLGPDTVDALLRLAEAAVGPLHRVARRPQQLVIEELQRLPGPGMARPLFAIALLSSSYASAEPILITRDAKLSIFAGFSVPCRISMGIAL